MIYACTKKLRKTSVVEPFLRLLWLNVEPHFIAFLTGKMFRPRISLKVGRFRPGFQWTKCRSIPWKENQRIFDQFVLSLFSARTFLTGDLAISKSENFWIQIFLFGFLSSDLQTSFKLVDAKKVNEQIVENRIEIDRSEAENYGFIHESCVFFITFFPT